MTGNDKKIMDGIAERLQHEFQIEQAPLSETIVETLQRLHEIEEEVVEQQSDRE